MIPNPVSMPDDPDTEAFVEAVKKGIAAADSGRTVPYEEARKWLLSWGTENELSEPKCR
ncbi:MULTISPECIES: CopG family transcriptional regulator [Acidiphilium]|uniref:CopG family transcriptional regulator n=1 Tax=Acidiphilium TaxID=522 RepID=UPI0009D6D1E8|nr:MULTISPECIES: CopG family transcriptional regulator [Acidiphilium]